MKSGIFTYPLIIREHYLDSFGHVNNAAYLTFYEEARWELITQGGYALQKIRETGKGPVILDVYMTFLKELRARDEIIIESQTTSYEKKIGKMTQKMIRSGEICSTAEFTFGLFDTIERKLILPTPEWLKAIGTDDAI